MPYYYLENSTKDKTLQYLNTPIQLGTRWLSDAKNDAQLTLFQKVWRGVAGTFVYLSGLPARGISILLEKRWCQLISEEEIQKQTEIAKDKIFSRGLVDERVILPFIQARFPWDRYELIWLDYSHAHISSRTFQPDGHASRLLSRIADSQKKTLVIGIDQEMGRYALTGTPNDNQKTYSEFGYLNENALDTVRGKLVPYWAGRVFITSQEAVQKKLSNFCKHLQPQA